MAKEPKKGRCFGIPGKRDPETWIISSGYPRVSYKPLQQEGIPNVSLTDENIDISVMTRLLKDELCIKVTFMHNGCWVNYYEKHSLR